MLATEPLSEEFWASTGLAERQTWNDLRHLVIYGQRTADGRLAFGGRGAPYHFGLEAGSKPELMAVMAMASNDTPIICNGFKDAEFIEAAMSSTSCGTSSTSSSRLWPVPQ